jgi:hypothetical protein
MQKQRVYTNEDNIGHQYERQYGKIPESVTRIGEFGIVSLYIARSDVTIAFATVTGEDIMLTSGLYTTIKEAISHHEECFQLPHEKCFSA